MTEKSVGDRAERSGNDGTIILPVTPSKPGDHPMTCHPERSGSRFSDDAESRDLSAETKLAHDRKISVEAQSPKRRKFEGLRSDQPQRTCGRKQLDGGAHHSELQIYKIKTPKSIGAHQIHAEFIKEAPCLTVRERVIDRGVKGIGSLSHSLVCFALRCGRLKSATTPLHLKCVGVVAGCSLL